MMSGETAAGTPAAGTPAAGSPAADRNGDTVSSNGAIRSAFLIDDFVS
jgi:hypothetical protein